MFKSRSAFMNKQSTEIEETKLGPIFRELSEWEKKKEQIQIGERRDRTEQSKGFPTEAEAETETRCPLRGRTQQELMH